jgi:hypothetical protein
MNLEPEDLKIDIFGYGLPSGESYYRVTHIPTGKIGCCDQHCIRHFEMKDISDSDRKECAIQRLFSLLRNQHESYKSVAHDICNHMAERDIEDIGINDAINQYIEHYDNAWEYFKTNNKFNHPIIPKFLLSREIVERFHGEAAARKAFDDWVYEFKNRKPSSIEEKNLSHHEDKIPLKNLLKNCGLVSSTSEALRMIKQNGVKIDDIIASEDVPIAADNVYRVFQVGKKRFLKVRASNSKGFA